MHYNNVQNPMASSPDSVDPPKAECEAPGAPAQWVGSVSFEQTLVRLEEIVRLLEDGKIGLDEALSRYEEGVGLLRRAYDMLQRAERKIELLTGLDSEGNPILRSMEDAASFPSAKDIAAPVSTPTRRGKGRPRDSSTFEPE